MKIFQTKTFLFCICFLSAWFAASITMDLREAPIRFSGIKQNAAVQNTGGSPKQYQKFYKPTSSAGLFTLQISSRRFTAKQQGNIRATVPFPLVHCH